MAKGVLTKWSILVCISLAAAFPIAVSADEKLPSKADSSCVKCHPAYEKAEALFAGKLVDVSSKAKVIQLMIDKDMEIIYFDDSTELKNAPALKDIPKQESVRITYHKKDGKNLAKLVEVKKGIDLPKERMATLEEVQALVAQGPTKGKYMLLDSRPDNLYNEGHIPTALSMPFGAFDKLAETMLKDKELLQIYYCAGDS